MESSDIIAELIYVKSVFLDVYFFKLGPIPYQHLAPPQRVRLKCDPSHRQISAYLYNKCMIGAILSVELSNEKVSKVILCIWPL